MKFNESKISGCYEIQPRKLQDERGAFVKTFHEEVFREHGLCTDFKEEYYSASKKNVIRGMHFQLPPHDHEKMVYCTAGRVMDVVVDLRQGSPTYGKHVVFELSSEKANMIYIPKGMAHGFAVLSESATMLYKVSTVYAPNNEGGIYWDSIGLDWAIDNAVVSERDEQLILLGSFESPFVFEGKTS